MRRLTAIVPVLVAAAAGWAVLTGLTERRVPPPPAAYLAYRAELGSAVTFPIAASDRDLALTLHLQVPGAAAGAPLRYRVNLELADADGEPRWRGQAVLHAKVGGAVVASEPLTAARALRLALPDAGDGARLRVWGEALPGDMLPGGSTLVRLVRRAPPGELAREQDAPAPLGDAASTLGWALLDGEDLSALDTEPTARRAAPDARGAAELVLVRIAPAERAPTLGAVPPGEALGPGRAAAWTVRGPGAIRLSLSPLADPTGELVVRVRTVDHRGTVVDEVVPVPAGGAERRLAAPAGGALSVIARCDDARGAWARAFAVDDAVPLGEVFPAGDVGELHPDRRRSPMWRIRARGTPLRATLAGDGVARIVARPSASTPAPRLAWRLLDARGAPLARGDVPLPAGVAPLDQVVQGPRVAPIDTTASTTFVAESAPGSILELDVPEGVVDVALAAADDPPAARLAPAYDVPLAGARLRGAPWLRSRWVPFLPDNHEALERVELQAQVRLEPEPDEAPGGPWRTLEPSAPRTHQVLRTRIADPDAWRPFHRTGFAVGQRARLLAPEQRGGSGRLALDYVVSRDAIGSELVVHVDGAVAVRRPLKATRGRIRLRDLTPGAHEIFVEGPPGDLVTTAAPDRDPGAAHPLADRVVWRVGPHSTVPVPPDAAWLMVELWGEAPPSSARPIEVRLDVGRGRRPSDGPGPRDPPATHEIARPAAPAESRWLDRDGGARRRARFVVRIDPVAQGGPRTVTVVPSGGRDLWARFLVPGPNAPSPLWRTGVEWEDD